MNITSATYIGSKPNHTQCPNDGRPEYAFIGRSNVGKSSLINALTGRKNLALTSSTPGKTMCINHFLINEQWYIVDLPGYGYAQRGKKEVEKLKTMISSYVLEREQLTCLFVLIDIRHDPQKVFGQQWSSLCHRIHQGRQTHPFESEACSREIPSGVEGGVGRVASIFHYECQQ